MSDTREDLEARIAAYIDGELPPADAARLEVFLANTDPALAEQIIGMLGDRHNLRALPKPRAPIDLAGRIMEQVERATLLNDIPQNEHQPRPWWQSKAAIAAGFILVLGGFSYFVANAVLGPHDAKVASVASKEKGLAGAPSARPVDEELAMRDAVPSGGAPAAGPGAGAAFDALKDAVGENHLDTSFSKAGAADDKSLAAATAAAPLLTEKELAVAEKTEAGLPVQFQRNHEVLQSNQAAANKMGYAAVDSPARALTNITVGNTSPTPEPIVITLVAQDDHDFARLRSTLEDIMNQDPAAARRQVALQARYLNVLSNSNFNGGNITNGNVTNGNSTTRVGNNYDGTLSLNNNSGGQNQSSGNLGTAISGIVTTTTAPAVDGDVVDNTLRYKIYSPKAKDFADVPAPVNSPATSQGAALVLGPVIAPQTSRDDAAKETPKPKDAKEALEQKQAAVASPAPAQTQSQSETVANGQALLNNTVRHGNWESQPTPYYRVALRPEQIEQLAQQFHVDTITSGRQAYVITPDNDEQHPGAGERIADATKFEGQKEGYYQKSSKDLLDRREEQPAATQVAAGKGGADHNLAKKIDEKAADKSPLPAAPASAASTAPAAPPAYNYRGLLTKDTPWLECIITMEPRPATPTDQHPAR